MIGKMLGHYRIIEKLGQGGMGEVFLAEDLSLGRKAALKFLPENFTGDAERMARFEREAKLLASLNHPNIAGIYGLEQTDGKRFLALEHVDGETLGQRIAKGPIPVEEALDICRQIAEGVEAAHEKGVIHRDLKPENVKITSDGKVKVLDFGLAKALADEAQDVALSQSPTITEAMTRPGVILGTAAYMSPEQAKGKPVDKRTDIWAFGVILYEMLTGRQLFKGETVSDVLASVLREEPNFEIVPEKVRPLLRRCLAKDVKRRLRDIGDAMPLLEEAPRESAQARSPRLAWTWAAVATLLLIAVGILHFAGREAPKTLRFHLSVPPMPNNYSLALSPDGRTIAYVASASPSAACLYICEVGSVSPRRLDGTDGAIHPFWSPDGRSIGYFAGGRLKRVDLSGGPPRDICAAGDVSGGTWNRDGVILFGDWPVLRRVSAEGGNPVAVTSIDESQREVSHFFPSFLPDGNHYLFGRNYAEPSLRGIYLGSLDSREAIRLLPGKTYAAYAEPGYLLYQREGTLLAQPFDIKKLEISGEAVPVAENLLWGDVGNRGSFEVSQNGVLIYRTGAEASKSRFVWLDRSGRELEQAGDPAMYLSDFDLSPDGRLIAVRVEDPATSAADIWLLDWNRNIQRRFTDDPADDIYACWSPDGSRIAYTTWKKGNAEICEKKADGTGGETVLLNSQANEWVAAWTKDGRYLAYGIETASDVGDISILPLFGDRKPFTIVQSRGTQWSPDFSYDGKWLAYASNESGMNQIYIISFPAADRMRQISSSGGVQPRWRRDGKELYYLSLDGKIMAVDITAGSNIDSGVPQILFDAKLSGIADYNRLYTSTPDGQRFLLLKSLAEATAIPITVVLNWTAGLKK